MNIAFEISPLITASGTFGDKSGVYRYMYGLLTALVELLKKKDSKTKIILFTFNKDLLRFPLNQDMIRLINNNNVVFLDKFPKMKYSNLDHFDDWDILYFPPVSLLVKIVEKFIKIRSIYANYIINKTFKNYLKKLEEKLKLNKVKIIFHSETGFFPIKDFKNVITIYDLTPFLHPEFHRHETIDLQKRKIKFAKKYCDGIICISQRTKKDLLKYSDTFTNKKIAVIYPSVNLELTNQPKISKYIMKDINNLINSRIKKLFVNRYLLYYGTFEPRKNIYNLVKSFINLYENHEIPKDFKLVLSGGVGWGNVIPSIQIYVKEIYPIQKNCPLFILDYINDTYLKVLIKNAYAVVYPSLYEGFGLPVLESMSIGTPVICSYNSSLPEVGGDAVLYIDPKNSPDIEDKIKSLINNPDFAKELSEKGLVRSSKFCWNKSAEKLYNFMHKI